MREGGGDDEAYGHSRCTFALQMLHGHHQDKGRTLTDLQTCPQETFWLLGLGFFRILSTL
jgi:hypothetical protein